VGAGVLRDRGRGPDDLDGRLTGDAGVPRPSRLRLTHGLEQLEGAPSALFIERTLDERLVHVRTEGWATSALELPELGRLVVEVSRVGNLTRLLELDDVLVEVGLYAGRAWVTAAAREPESVAKAVERLRELLPPPDPSSAHEVTVTFWTYGPHGPSPSWRSIVVPAWEEIHENYSAPTQVELERLMTGFRPAHGGQLILWHGIAGTGKTFGLRALAWEWREWCDFHYIVDPDSFFGEHADYLMGVLLQPEYVIESMPSPHGFISRGWGSVGLRVEGDEDEEREDSASKWRVLLLEDTGELLAADARVRVGQGLSRFLNVVDGLIGQGLKVLVLVTTNEEIRRLHPAVARPGRSAANVEFVSLTADESNAWLERQSVEERVQGATTLASLYARKEGLDPGTTTTSPGFGG
jgi:uncharacterized protein DUF5925/ATPase family protein associated with various cellular activities (AAA)